MIKLSWLVFCALPTLSKVDENRFMSRPTGIPKTGGRTKGTPNLKTLVLRESLRRVGFDIVNELHELYPSLDPQTQAKVLLSFLPYLFPKPEVVSVSCLKTNEMAKESLYADPLGGLDAGMTEEE